MNYRQLPLSLSLSLSLLLFLFLPLCSSAQTAASTDTQSESHDFITYDTTIHYTCLPDSIAAGCSGQVFTVRISRPANYFTAGHPDTASRPWILTMPGLSEVGTDTSYLHAYGPHYWLQNGWDGSVQLNNGKHYPILMTVIASSAHVVPAFVQCLMDTLIGRYHPKKNSLHIAAYGMGVQVMGMYLGYEATAGDEHNMANIRSFTDLEGQAPGDYHGHSPLTYPYFMGHWASAYGGKFLGLEGDKNSRNIWQISGNMNDSLTGSAYFAYNHYGAGTFCCFDSLYDPSVTDWRCIAPITNTHILTSTLHPNAMGTYTMDPITGTNLFQWMLRQGDTTLITAPAASTGPKTLVGPGEYQVFFLDSSKHIYAVGTNLNTQGVGNTGTPGTSLPLAVPSTVKFKAIAGSLHGGAAIDSSGYVWAWGDNEQGQVGNGTPSTHVLSPVQLTTDSAGNAFSGITALASYYTNNASQGWFAVRSDSSLWVWGQTLNGMRGDGTTGSSISSRPVQVPIPDSRKVIQIAAGNQLIVLCSDSTVWTCGGASGNAQNLGYAATSTTALSLHQLSIAGSGSGSGTPLSGITQIAGGGPFNYALKSNGTLYGWGYYGYYMGGTGGTNSPLATPTDLTTRLNLPLPVRTIAVNMNCTHVILSDSSLWGWGDNAQGGIGNGQELDYSTTTAPYAWDFKAADLLQQSPVQVTTRKDWIALFSIYPYVMFTYAETANGDLYSWGRNKGAVLGNGIVGCASQVIATYPNSWDITTPTLVTPLAITSTTIGPCPYCVLNPTTSPCNQCATTAALTPTPSTTTSATVSPDHVPSRLDVYPNISKDGQLLNLALSSDNNGSLIISIYDLNGRLLRSSRFQKSNSYFYQSLNTGPLPGGMYLIKATIAGKEQLTARFIRQ